MGELAKDELLDGKYKIQGLIGRGAWAVVYEATNVRIQRRVAIKVLNAELAANPELLQRFTREAEACVQISSPYVVDVFDAGALADGRPYIVMEFLEGENLQQRIERVGQVDGITAATYAVQALSGLADAHSHGVLHRDVKPENLVVVKSKMGEEVVKLVDFGISKPSVARPEMLAMTRTDLVLGSPVYMSPEQARGTRHMDERSDLYSVGVVLYEIVTKELPHEAENFNELMFKIALENAPDPRTKTPELDAELAEIILMSLAREPDARFQTAVEFRDALLGWLESQGAGQRASTFMTSNIRARSESSARLRIAHNEDEKRRSSLTGKNMLLASTSPTSAPAGPQPSRPNRTIPIVIGCVLVLLLIGGGTFAMVHRQVDPKIVEPAVTPAPPPTPIPTPVPTVEPPPPVTVATGTTAPPPPSAAPAPAPFPRFPGHPHPPATHAAASTSAAPPPVATPATTSTAVEGRSIRTTF